MLHLCWRAFPLVRKSFQRWIDPFQKLNCKPVLVVFLDSLSGNQESYVWSVLLPLNWSKQEKSALGCQMCPSLLHPEQSCASKPELLEQRVLNKIRNTTLCWRVALPEKCLFLWDRNQNIIFLLGCLGRVLSREGLGHRCVGDSLVSTPFKARNLVLNERRIRAHRCLLESKQHWRSGRAQPGYNCTPWKSQEEQRDAFVMFDSVSHSDVWRGSAVFVSGQSFAPAGRRQRGRALGSQLLSQSLEQSGSHGAATTFFLRWKVQLQKSALHLVA